MGDWFASHKKMGALVIVLLIAGIGAGGFFAFQEFQRRQSGAYALEQLQGALNPPDTDALAHLVDFKSLGQDMARAAREAFPFMHEGNDQERSISHGIQKALLKKFMEKPKSGSQFPEDQSESAQLQKPLQMLPDDLAAQLMTNARVRDTGPGSAVIEARVENKQLKRSFDLQFGLQRTGDGWVVRHLLNAPALAQELRAAMLERHASLRNVYLEKNAATTKKMDAAIPLQKCEADAGVLSDGKTFVMVVHAVAKNISNVQINNFNLDASLYNPNGQALWRRFLNAAQPVPPGAVFDHRWSYELDAHDPLARKLLQGPLQCRASWQTLSLGNGQVWHIAEVPNPDQPCDKPGHDHPAGFCMLPSFQR